MPPQPVFPANAGTQCRSSGGGERRWETQGRRTLTAAGTCGILNREDNQLTDAGGSAARREFIRAWYAWQRVALPVESFRQNRIRSPTLQLEHDLDHLRTYVQTTGGRFLSGTRWDWPLIVQRHLDELRNAGVELERLALDDAEKRPYREFVAATRRLLTALATAAEPSAAADGEPE